MLGLLKSLGRKKRRFDRAERDVAVYLFSAHHLLGRAKLLDTSEAGCRIQSEERRALEKAVYMLNPMSATVAGLTNAWVNEDQAGYVYTSFASLRGFVSDPKLCEIRQFWQSVASEHSVIAPGGSFSQGQ